MAAGFLPAVERWRDLATREGDGVPPDLILAIIEHESKGNPAARSYRDTKAPAYTATEAACGLPVDYRRRALGLMQVTPGLWRSYNAKHPGDVTPCDLVRPEGAAKQIRVGASYLRSCLEWARTIDAVENAWPGGELGDTQIAWASLAYARGQRGTRDQVERAAAAGYARSLAGLYAYDPKWGAPEHPFQFARRIVYMVKERGSVALPPPGKPGAPARNVPPVPVTPGAPVPAAPKKDLIGSFGPILLYLLILLWRSNQEKEKGQEVEA